MAGWSGGRVFNLRGEGDGPSGSGVIFRNIHIEDPRPTLQQFFRCNTVPPPYAKDCQKRGSGDISGVLFKTSPSPRPACSVNDRFSGATQMTDNRRHFLRLAALAPLAAGTPSPAPTAIPRTGGASFRPGLNAYSFLEQLSL